MLLLRFLSVCDAAQNMIIGCRHHLEPLEPPFSLLTPPSPRLLLLHLPVLLLRLRITTATISLLLSRHCHCHCHNAATNNNRRPVQHSKPTHDPLPNHRTQPSGQSCNRHFQATATNEAHGCWRWVQCRCSRSVWIVWIVCWVRGSGVA